MTTARAALVREVKARPEFEVRGTKMEARPSGRLPLVRGETVLVLPMDSPAAGETVELLVDLEREKLPVTLGERVILPSSAFAASAASIAPSRCLHSSPRAMVVASWQ
jgi:hypothetical protein